MKADEHARTAKGEQTRARILQAALELFRESGYEDTTMRAVARKAQVSIGNAYYYFESKEFLLQAYYHRIHEEHLAASEPVLAEEKKLHDRLLGVLKAKLDVIEPYHRFSSLLFRTAADPHSPLNPFNEASAGTRREGTELFARVLEGSGKRIPGDIAEKLPDLLWMYSMGIVLFWLHDDSEGRARTHRLVEHTCKLVVRLIGLLANPVLRPLRKATLGLLKDLEDATAAEQVPDR